MIADASEIAIAADFDRAKVEADAEIWAELNGLPTRLRVRHSADFTRIGNADIALFVARDGQLALLNGPKLDTPQSAERIRTWLFGPALILALARQGVYCLHASSILLQGRAYVLIGRSGAGKSTLARAAQTPLTDDISPIGNSILLPQFPQLKLHGDSYPNLAESYPLGGFVHVMRSPSAQESLSAMDAPTLTRLLLSHTIAARLFHADELAPHLRWCAQIAEKFAASSTVLIPSYQANVPMRAAKSALALLDAFAASR